MARPGRTAPRDIREAIKWLDERGQLLRVEREVDPDLEIAALQIANDRGPAVLCSHIKGFPRWQSIGNVFSRLEVVARLLGFDCYRRLVAACRTALIAPISPRVVRRPAAQEVVLGCEQPVGGLLPILRATSADAGPIMGSGMLLLSGKYAAGGNDISFKRMHFRGADWASIAAVPGSHADALLFGENRASPIPATVNVTASPATMLVAAGGMLHGSMPLGCDELAVAGSLEGGAIEIGRALSVDAYCLANAEVVLEGKILPERVWESDEAEKNHAPRSGFFPEWHGEMGMAWKARKFQVEAVTMRKDPIYYSWLADGRDGNGVQIPMREACFWDLADRVVPGLVQSSRIPYSFRAMGGVVFQVKKRDREDDARVRELLRVAAASQDRLKLVLAVDEDVDTTDPEDLLWALAMRANGAALCDEAGLRSEKGSRGGQCVIPPCARIDATIPFQDRPFRRRPNYS